MEQNDQKWMYIPQNGEQFFFMHIPKTGGTTFRKMLTSHFPEGSYYPTKDDLILNGGRYFNQKELLENNPEILTKSLIMGHYNINFAQYLNPNVKTIAFFRNPFDRILSHVKHILANDARWKGVDPNDLIATKINGLKLVQSKYMGFEKGAFENVKANMKNIDFIGILEYFDESIELFNKKFNTNIDFIPKQNKSSLILDTLTDKTMSLISRSIAVEILTYKRAFEEFQDRCKKNKINF